MTRSELARANAQAQFERNGYFIPPWACKIGGYITIHNRFHKDQSYPGCPVCNGTLEQLKAEEIQNGTT
jgi:uncharacterized protein with PIN domain